MCRWLPDAVGDEAKSIKGDSVGLNILSVDGLQGEGSERLRVVFAECEKPSAATKEVAESDVPVAGESGKEPRHPSLEMVCGCPRSQNPCGRVCAEGPLGTEVTSDADACVDGTQ